MKHLTTEELEAGLPEILQSPKEAGRVELIVRRPADLEREILSEGMLDTRAGLVGDLWGLAQPSADTMEPLNTDNQLTLMNTRVIALLTQDAERWALAGDQLFVDLDLSSQNLPAGTRLQIGEALVEVTALPHTGCSQFKARFGKDALVFVNGPAHRNLRMRGINARVLQNGVVRTGDSVQVIR